MSLDRVALGTIAMSLEELVHRLEAETVKAGENDEMAIALLDIERQLQSCVRRFNAAVRTR